MKGIQDAINARLGEIRKLLEPLRAEAEQLSKLIAVFEDPTIENVPAPRSSRRRRAAAAPAGAEPVATGDQPAPPVAKRGRPLGSGNRAAQALTRIAEQPGITASELAAGMGISSNYLYRVLPRLEREAKILKRGKGYHPVTDAGGPGLPNDQ